MIDWFSVLVSVSHTPIVYMVAPALECVWMGSCCRGKGMGRDISLIFKFPKYPKFGEFEGEGFQLYLKNI